MRLGVEVLKSAANPRDVLTNIANKSLGTSVFEPLTFLLRPTVDTDVYQLSFALKSIRLWADMVSQAGINLCQYGAWEAEAWKHIQSGASPDSYSCTLLYGSTPAEWSIKIHGPVVRLKTFELIRGPPGSFPCLRDERVPTQICWKPFPKEWNQGSWTELKTISLLSQPRVIEDWISDLQRAELFEELVAEAQDDAGPIVLLQLRASRSKSSTSRARSHSQPPSLPRIDQPTESRTRPWLNGFHLCCSGSEWN